MTSPKAHARTLPKPLRSMDQHSELLCTQVDTRGTTSPLLSHREGRLYGSWECS